MSTHVRELRVFMASPGDLDDERESLRNVERRINAMFRERGVRVSLAGWEEVQPEAGRPQALINPLVHECEIFIGLLSMRWGSATGTYSSGFEEEFEIALARRTQNDETPAIGMFFKTIDPERLADKGPQLTAVLAFQDRVRRERLALYRTFNSADQLALEIFEFLAPYAMRLADELTAGVETGTAATGSVPNSVEPAGVESSEGAERHASEGAGTTNMELRGLDSAQRQITDALQAFAEMFTDSKPLAPTVRDRVTLVGTAFAKDQRFLGAHHVNRLYKQRANLDLTLGEARAWYRTYLANVGSTDREGRTVPIWGVFDVHNDGPSNHQNLWMVLGEVTCTWRTFPGMI